MTSLAPLGDHTPQDHLNAALWRAVQAVLDARNEITSLCIPERDGWEMMEERAQVAALPALASILPDAKLHQTVARALGAEALRLVLTMDAVGNWGTFSPPEGQA